MALFRFPITLRGPLATPLQGNTLWGQLCWLLRDVRGERALAGFIGELRDGNPPFVLGDACPAGLLPLPLLPPLTSSQREQLVGDCFGGDRQEAFRRMKQIGKRRLLPESLLRELADGLEPLELQKRLLAMQEEHAPDALGKAEIQPHVSLGRVTGSAIEGAFFLDEVRYHDGPLELWAWLRDDFSPDTLCELLATLGQCGYGRDAAVGRGVFDVGQPVPVDWPVEGAAANAAMALGSFAPAPRLDPVRGRWSTRVHRGRLGNRYATAAPPPPGGGLQTPFKKPQLLLNPGSTLEGADLRPWFGRLLDNVHRLPEIAQAACCSALPLRLATGQGENHA